MNKLINKVVSAVIIPVLLLAGFLSPVSAIPAYAATAVTVPASASVTSDSFNGSSVSLPALILTEGQAGEIPVSTLTWALPSGFVLDTSTVANVVYSGTDLNGSDTVSFVDSTHFSVTITATSSVAGSITIGSVTPLKIKTTAGTPLAISGNILLSAGTLPGVSSSTNFGTLTQVPGLANKLAFTVQPETTSLINTSLANFKVSVQDQFGNVLTSDNGRAITLAPTIVGSSTLGALSGSTTINDTAGVSTFTGISYNQTGTVLLRADATSLTSALSNSIVFSSIPTQPGNSCSTSTLNTRLLKNGIVVKIEGSDTVYLVVNNTLRPFYSAAIFHAKGKKFQNIEKISNDLYKKLGIGKPVGEGRDDDDTIINPPAYCVINNSASTTTPSSLSNLPDGTVVKIPGNPTVYLVLNGQLQPISSLNIFRSWKKRFEDIKEISASTLNTLPLGSPATFADGTLLKGPGNTIYVMKNGQLYGIPNMKVMQKNGWSLGNVLQVQGQDLSGLATGGIED